jgi:hypothetical protein
VTKSGFCYGNELKLTCEHLQFQKIVLGSLTLAIQGRGQKRTRWGKKGEEGRGGKGRGEEERKGKGRGISLPNIKTKYTVDL